MTELFGATRTVLKERYTLLAPGGFAPSGLPGWEGVTCVVLVSPAMGARFCQLHVTFGKDGQGRGNTGGTEYFAYVLEGHPSITLADKRHRLEPGSFAYIPPGEDIHFQGTNARMLIYQKRFIPLNSRATAPKPIISHQRETKGEPFHGHEDIRQFSLLPDNPQFDLAVNIYTFAPGAALPFLETHVMERGMMVLSGQGICRLGEDYHPVQTGDALWTAPYCPQWFAAIGKAPAGYICYKDVNRDPM